MRTSQKMTHIHCCREDVRVEQHEFKIRKKRYAMLRLCNSKTSFHKSESYIEYFTAIFYYQDMLCPCSSRCRPRIRSRLFGKFSYIYCVFLMARSVPRLLKTIFGRDNLQNWASSLSNGSPQPEPEPVAKPIIRRPIVGGNWKCVRPSTHTRRASFAEQPLPVGVCSHPRPWHIPQTKMHTTAAQPQSSRSTLSD
jgi:hypothetical protein